MIEEKNQEKTVCFLRGQNLIKEFVAERKPIIGTPKRFFRALDDVSFEIKQGETVGVVGESGSGKSTLGEILGDLRDASSGQVIYKGKDVSQMNKAEYHQYRKSVQFIFQDPKGSMNPHFKIKDVVAEPLITLKISNDKEEIEKMIIEMIKKVGLEADTIEKYPGEISGGQCQRVAIARALIVNPEVIICDEAVSALDVSVQAQILNLLRDLQAQFNTAYIFISHDIGVVNYMADRIIVMNRGQIVEKGTADQVFKNPQEEYTKKLVESSFSS